MPIKLSWLAQLNLSLALLSPSLFIFLFQYKDPTFASTQPDGLAVLAIFVKTGKAHSEFKKLSEYLSYVPYKNDMIHVQQTVDPTKIIPC